MLIDFRKFLYLKISAETFCETKKIVRLTLNALLHYLVKPVCLKL